MRIQLYTIAFILAASTVPVPAADWPAYRHDNRRSAVTSEQLAMPLKRAWTYQSELPPQTAWSAPAKWDAYSGNDGLQSMRNFDPAFFVTAVGELVYFGSSVDNAAHCLDAATGESRWIFHTESAVRLPPTIGSGKAYFGSDDGSLYCVDAAKGELAWKHSPVADVRLIPSNGKLISPWPVRTGALVQGDLVYYGASLLPWRPSYLCAVNANSGKTAFVEMDNGVTLQGALLGSEDALYAPQGRSVPLRYGRSDGKRQASLGGSGGVFCILTEEEQLIAMPSSQKGKQDELSIRDPNNKNSALLTLSGTKRMIVKGNLAYIHQGKEVVALDRKRLSDLQVAQTTGQREVGNLKKLVAEKKKKGEDAASLEEDIKRKIEEIAEAGKQMPECFLWRKSPGEPLSFALAGETLFVGFDGAVRAFDVKSGDELWQAEVKGRVYGVVVANGRLLLSTDRGGIVCYASK